MEDAGRLTLGEAVARFRTRAGLSQQRLAEQLGKNRRAIAAWERGEYLPKTKGDVLELTRILKLNDEETALLLKAAGMDPSLPVWNVPYHRNPYFTGRDELLAQLDQYLVSPKQAGSLESRRVALTQPHAVTGLGGIGKTQVAVEYAYRSYEQGRYIHTLWVNATSQETTFASFVEIAELLPAFAARNETDQRKLIEAVKRWLEQCKQPWLLIFDNVDHDDDLHALREYLPQRGYGSILLTTRASAVGSLATALEVETMGLIEGAFLLLRRAHRVKSTFDLDRISNEEHISKEEIDQINRAGNIVQVLDSFPLALDQAGAFIEQTQCSLEEYLNLYQTHRRELLTKRGEMATDYPDSVATTWSLSFQRVQQKNPAAAEFLALCAFLAPDRIPEELFKDGAAYWPSLLQQAATDHLMINQMIEELLKYSLIKRLVEDRFLGIHRLVQVVQRDSMSPETQHQWAERAVRAINAIFPEHTEDITTWPQCLRYLDQAQAGCELIELYGFTSFEAASILNRTGFYLMDQTLYLVAEPLFQRALTIKEQQQSPDHLSIAISLNNLAALYKRQGKHAEAEPLFERVLQIRTQQLGSEHPSIAEILNNLADLYAFQGRYAEAESLYQRALAIGEQQLGFEHFITAQILNNLASLYRKQGKYAEAEATHQRALMFREQQLGPEHPATAESLNNLVTLYLDQGRYAEAEPLCQRALVIREKRLGEEHSVTAVTVNNLAELYRRRGKYAEAEPLYQRALMIQEKQLGPDHLANAVVLNNLALLYQSQARYIESESIHQRALAIREQWLGPEHPDVAQSLSNLAELYQKQDRYEEAEPLYWRALSIGEQQLGPEHPSTALYLNILGLFYLNQGHYAEAEPLCQRALAIREQRLGPEHPSTVTCLNNLAKLYKKQKKYEQAEPLYQRVLTIRKERMGPEHPDTASSLNNLALLYHDQGRYTEAEPLYQRALAIAERVLGSAHRTTQTIRKNYATLLALIKQKEEPLYSE